MKNLISFSSNALRLSPAIIATILCSFSICEKAIAAEAAPTVAPSNQVFSSGPQSVTITDTDGSAVIHYTVNNTTPTSSSPTYSAPFAVSTTTTIQAIAIGSGGTSSVTTSVVQIDPTTANVPRSGLLTWQKSDLGLTLSGSSVTGWQDASGNGMNMVTTSGDTSPALRSNAINGFSAVTFDGVANGLMWPSGFADLTAGCTVFINYHPIGRTSGFVLSLAYNNGSNLMFFPFWNGGQPMGIMVNSYAPAFWSTFYTGQFQNLSFIHNGAGNASYFIDGQLLQQSAVTNFSNVPRNQNYIGGAGYGTYFAGDYTEILVYNRPVTATEFANINAYLANRYLPPTVVAPVAPVFSLAAGMLSTPGQLGISTAPGAITHYTVDGTTPTAISPVVSSAIPILYSQTINAISIQNGLSSSVTSATYTLDNTKYPAPSVSDTSVMQINLQAPRAAQ